MNKILIVVAFLLTPLLFARHSYAQGTLRISGKIVSADDSKPIPHANVSIDGKGVATAANAGGYFALLIPIENVADSLKISCIGYKTKRLPINGLKDGQTLDLALEKSTTALKEVKVAYYDAAKILELALKRIPDNYIDHSHILRGFYRIYASNGDTPLQLSEAVFDVYNFGYADKRADQFRLEKARSEKNERDFAALELGRKPNAVFEEDIVNHLPASGFLSEDGRQQHVFKVTDVTDVRGHEAYEVSFDGKPDATDRTFSGRMFIDTQSYAFVAFDFGLSPEALNDITPGNVITQALMRGKGMTVDLKQDHKEVSYQEVGSKWVLSAVSGDHLLGISGTGFPGELPVRIQFNYQVTAVDTVARSSFGSKLDRNENINDRASDVGSGFWKDYNILLSDFNTEEVFKKLQAINKANKQNGK